MGHGIAVTEAHSFGDEKEQKKGQSSSMIAKHRRVFDGR